MEPTEVGEFGKQMQEAGESGMMHVSLIISVLAVAVAMVTVMGHRTHTEAVLMQSRSSDQWNEYQGHKIHSVQVQSNSDLLSLQPSSNDTAVQAKLKTYAAELDKLDDNMDEDTAKAKEFEAEVDRAERRASRWDLSEAMLQIGVVLASITLLTRRRMYVVSALLLGITGIVIAASTLLVK